MPASIARVSPARLLLETLAAASCLARAGGLLELLRPLLALLARRTTAALFFAPDGLAEISLKFLGFNLLFTVLGALGLLRLDLAQRSLGFQVSLQFLQFLESFEVFRLPGDGLGFLRDSSRFLSLLFLLLSLDDVVYLYPTQTTLEFLFQLHEK